MIEIYDCFDQVSRQLDQKYLTIEGIYYYVLSLSDSLPNMFPVDGDKDAYETRQTVEEDFRFWCEQKIKLTSLLQTYSINITKLLSVVESLISYQVIEENFNGVIVLKHLLTIVDPDNNYDHFGINPKPFYNN